MTRENSSSEQIRCNDSTSMVVFITISKMHQIFQITFSECSTCFVSILKSNKVIQMHTFTVIVYIRLIRKALFDQSTASSDSNVCGQLTKQSKTFWEPVQHFTNKLLDYIWIKVQKSIIVDLKHVWWNSKSKLTCEAQSSGKKIAKDPSCNMTTRGGHRKQRNACRLNKGLIGPIGYKYHKSRQLSM